MIPHERSLVKKMQGKPFALLGVNTDDNLNKIKPQLQKDITWRSWYDGSGGPITKQYQVRSFPTIFVLDAKGIIRYKNVRNEAMDNAVETLIKELEKSGGGTASADDKPGDKGSDEKPGSGGGSNASAPIGFEVGNRAPEITGKDTTGKTFKLSEYKGKVVVLDFWGFW